MRKIEIKNSKLKEYLEYKLNKNEEDEILEEELEDISEIIISGNTLSNEKLKDDLSDLKYFRNLKKCMIKDIIIADTNVDKINKLNKLETLYFDNCNFENSENKIQLYLEKLILTFCNNVQISGFKIYDSVIDILIDSGKDISLKGIENFEKLEKLHLKSLKLTDLTNICKLQKLKYLNLNGSIVKDKKSLEILKTKLDLEYKSDNLKI